MFGRNCLSRFFSDGRMCFRSRFWWTTCWQDCILQRSELLLAVNMFGRNCLSRFFLTGECVFEATSGGQHVDRTVFFNDQNCCWQSICSEEIVCHAFFLTGECVFEAISGGQQHVDRTVLFNDQNCCWQSICSEEIVCHAFFWRERKCFRSHFWWALNFHDLFVTGPFIVGF